MSKLVRTITAIGALLSFGLTPTIASAADSNPVPPGSRQFNWVQTKFPLQAAQMDAMIAAGGPTHPAFRHITGYQFTGGADYHSVTTQLKAIDPSNYNKSQLCDTSLACLNKGLTNIVADGAFPLCETAKVAPCIDGLEYKLGDGDFQRAEFVRFADASPSDADLALAKQTHPTWTTIQTTSGWAPDLIPGLPGSATGPAIYRFPGVSNSAGSENYVLTTGYNLIGKLAAGKITSGNYNDFNVAIRPVLVDTTKSATQVNLQESASDGTNRIITASFALYSSDETAYFDKTSLGFAAQFPAGVKLRLSLRLPRDLGGWFQGRADSPDLAVSPINSKENLVVITANPTSVPITAADWLTFDPANKDLLAETGLGLGPDEAKNRADDANGNGGMISSGWQPAVGTKRFTVLARLLGDKAKGSISQWDFRRLFTTRQCMSDNSSLQGLLTTNAMTYQADLPTYSGGFLDYSVAGLHYDSNGKVFKGTYNFIMRDEVARCIYGFKGAGPISGTVSVTSADGAENVAYTSVTDQNGWLRLSANDFTFSNPTIRAKLTQEGSPSDPVSTTTTQSSDSSAGGSGGAVGSKTITCIKGKLTKKVAGATKCPAGWKKK